MRARLLVTGAMLGTLVLGAIGTPGTHAATGSCRVRDVTQGTHGTSLGTMVRAAVDGDRLTVSGVCLARFIDIDVDISIRGIGVRRAVLDARGRRKVMRIGSGAVVSLRHLVITGGVAGPYPGAGGGIRNDGALTLIDAVVRGNAAAFGGGIWSRGPLLLIGSLVRDNHADGNGGGILSSADLTLTDTIVRDNTAGEVGGGIFNHVDQDPVGVVTLLGTSSVTSNSPDDCVGTTAC